MSFPEGRYCLHAPRQLNDQERYQQWKAGADQSVHQQQTAQSVRVELTPMSAKQGAGASPRSMIAKTHGGSTPPLQAFTMPSSPHSVL